MKTLICSALILLVLPAYAQKADVSLRVVAEDSREGLDGANVALVNVKDSSIVYGAMSDGDGRVTISGVGYCAY